MFLKYLPAFVVLFLFISCKKSNQSTVVNQQKFLPISLYTINNSNKDTVNALEAMQIGYNNSNQIITLQYYGTDPGARKDFFNVNYINGRMSSIESGSTRFNLSYRNSGLLQEARYSIGIDAYFNCYYLFDDAGRVAVKVDSVVTSSIVREDSLIYSYTDTTLRMRRYINFTSSKPQPFSKGENQPTTWSFNKLIRSPFHNLEIDGMLFPPQVMLDASYYLMYNKMGMFRSYKYATIQGVVQRTMDFEVISYVPGANLPEVVRIVIDDSGLGGGITTTYHYFVYKLIL